MKKVNKLLMLSLSLMSTLIVSCNNNDLSQSSNNTTNTTTNTQTTTTSNGDVGYDDDFSYYFETKINDKKELKVFRNFQVGESKALNKNELVIATAIQGFFSRENGKYYYQFESNDTWLNDLKENYGFTFSDTSLEEMLKDFKNNFTNKYVLYDTNNKQLNVARSIAGIKNYIPVDVSLESLVKSLGFELGIDARGMSEEDCFDTYKNEFNNTALIQQNPETTQEFLTDYGIAGKFFFFWPDNGVDDLEFRSKVHTWAKKDSPIFGWVPVDEPTDINVCSTMGQFMIASDWARNMSVFAAKSSFGELRFNNPIKDDESIVAQDGKHYVTIMMSDGDNIQTWYNTFPISEKYLAAERGDFKMGWSINPSLSDLGRNIMNYVYDNRDENDFYVCSVSGQGYMNPRVYPQEALESFVNGLSTYLRKTDLSVVQILDGGPDKDVIEQYAKIPELNGGIYCYGDKYAGGRGSVYWANDKPFVAFRESLWDADTSVVANRINNYSTDVSNIEAYTAINLHPWSMEYKDVVDLVNKLDEHVEIVTADEFIRLIRDNVEHKDIVLI